MILQCRHRTLMSVALTLSLAHRLRSLHSTLRRDHHRNTGRRTRLISSQHRRKFVIVEIEPRALGRSLRYTPWVR